jgi:hypothetical protein
VPPIWTPTRAYGSPGAASASDTSWWTTSASHANSTNFKNAESCGAGSWSWSHTVTLLAAPSDWTCAGRRAVAAPSPSCARCSEAAGARMCTDRLDVHKRVECDQARCQGLAGAASHRAWQKKREGGEHTHIRRLPSPRPPLAAAAPEAWLCERPMHRDCLQTARLRRRRHGSCMGESGPEAACSRSLGVEQSRFARPDRSPCSPHSVASSCALPAARSDPGQRRVCVCGGGGAR